MEGREGWWWREEGVEEGSEWRRGKGRVVEEGVKGVSGGEGREGWWREEGVEEGSEWRRGKGRVVEGGRCGGRE